MCDHPDSDKRITVHHHGKIRKRCRTCERLYKLGVLQTKPRPKPIAHEAPVYAELARKAW